MPLLEICAAHGREGAVVSGDPWAESSQADQRLRADDPAAGDIHPRLVVDPELVAVERMAQTAFQFQTLVDGMVQFGREEASQRRFVFR
jgi:hypothetical protein